MELLKCFLLFETVVLAAVAWRRNGDPFSPVKIYIVYSTFFFSAIYVRAVRWETLACYASLIQSIAFCLAFEHRPRGRIEVAAISNFRVLYFTVWSLSIPAIATICYFIYNAGSIQQYLLSLAYRVETWKGQGHFVVFMNTLPALNLFYFAALIVNKRRRWTDVGFYGVHFVVFVIVGLLTASRSYIAVSVLGMCVMWAYLVRPPKLLYVAALAAILVAFASIMGAVRNNNYGGGVSEGFFGLTAGGVKLENAQMGYGVDPLEIVFTSPERVRFYGRSYLTIFTNFIPRSLWPSKPDTAGIVFTKMYTDDQTGLSYLATGAITEGILNFGRNFGAFFGILLNLLVLLCGCVFYNSMVRKSSRGPAKRKLYILVIYFYIILTCARFSYGEFTDLFQSLMFFCLLPLGLVQLSLRLRLRKRLPVGESIGVF